MKETKIDNYEEVTTADGRTMRLMMLKAQITKSILQNQKACLERLSPKQKNDFYYRVYQILDRQTYDGKKEPFLQMGLSPYTFMSEPLVVGGFTTNHGELFSRLHQAIKEAEGSFKLGENEE